jgi:eukaryotic-like serine/threonine-protein kinase
MGFTNDPAELLAGRYDLGEVIGRGGMGVVHRAWDTQLQRYVAVKLLSELAIDSAAARARFDIEAETLARLSHPGLITLIDAATAGDQPYLVMELVLGETLAERSRGVRMSPDDVVALGIRLADALGYVHDRLIVHRDLKPSNVLLGHDGQVKLADFGVVRLLDGATRHTATGMTMGTAGYLSPEQVRGEPVTVASDIYSLGLVLLEAFSGEPAFTGSQAEVALARLTGSPPMDERLPESLRALLTAMTASRPAQRPSAKAVETALRLILDRRQQPTEIIPTVRARPAHPVLALLGAVAAAAVVIAVLIRGLAPDSPGSQADRNSGSIKPSARPTPTAVVLRPHTPNFPGIAARQALEDLESAASTPPSATVEDNKGKGNAEDKGKGNAEDKGKGQDENHKGKGK